MPTDPLTAATRAAEAVGGLDLLVLFGSRARGDARGDSDWDFGYLASGGCDPDRLMAALVMAVGSDRIDVVDLARANGLLRFRAARDGRPLSERRPGTFARFWLDAVSFWCDAGPVLDAGYARVLRQVGP